ncbi:MAG: sigma-70 family RNA polymerase sigma factor [Cyanobacteria bacterium P01_E01_bin.6]
MSKFSADHKKTIHSLLEQYAKSGDLNTRNKLVELNIGLVKDIAIKISRVCREPQEDLIQVGFLGLIKAIEKYNPSRGSFSTIAVPFVRGEILHYLRDLGNTIRIPREYEEIRAKLNKLAAHERTDLKQVSKKLKIDLGKLKEANLAILNRTPLSFEVKFNHDNSVEIGKLLASESSVSTLESIDLSIAINNSLSSESGYLIFQIFFNDKTYNEMAERLNLSPVTISKRVKKAVVNLAEFMGA